MCQPPSWKRWIVVSALVCTLAGLVLWATDPVQHREAPPRLANEQPRRAVQRAALEVASPEPCETRRRLRSEEHTSELQSPDHLVCRLLLEKKKQKHTRG